MLRSIAVIVSGILLSRPGMPEEEAKRYAQVLQAEAKQHGFDPLTVVAMVHFESGWQPTAVSGDGEDYGLGQVRARFIGACRNDDDPLNAPSDECKKVKESLLDAETNLKAVAQIITDARKLCVDKTGAAPLHRWLASYQGLNFPSQKKWCKPGKKTWRVVKYRDELVRRLVSPPPRTKAKPGATVPAKATAPKRAPARKRS
jgi:hypothetical protein